MASSRSLLLGSISVIVSICSLCWDQCMAVDCEYMDESSGRMLYLDALSSVIISYDANPSPTDTSTYEYSPCRNAAGECPNAAGGSDTAMCRQTSKQDPTQCHVIANYDASRAPKFSTSGGGLWTFVFDNGDTDNCNGPRALEVNLFCNETAGDYAMVSAGEIDTCYYHFNIATKWACAGHVYRASTSNSSLSGGSVFLIIFTVLAFAYFAVGWLICGCIHRRERGFCDPINNIPNVTFWMKLPSLVMTGCRVTQETLLSLCHKNGNQVPSNYLGNGANGNFQNI